MIFCSVWHKRFPSRSNCRHTMLGGALAEGPVGIGLVILAIVVGTFVVVHVWQMIVYKQKIALAASAAAQYAADQADIPMWCDSFAVSDTMTTLEQNATSQAQSFLSDLGINPANATVTVSLDGRVVNVAVVCPALPVIGGAFLPGQVSMSETACCPVHIDMPPGLLTITSSSGNSVTLPVYGNPLTEADFSARHFSQFSIRVPAGSSIQSQQIGTVIDSNWLDWSPVYNN